MPNIPQNAQQVIDLLNSSYYWFRENVASSGLNLIKAGINLLIFILNFVIEILKWIIGKI